MKNIFFNRGSIPTVLLSAVLLALPLAASAQPSFTKSFSPSTIGPGSVSRLEFIISNGSASGVTDLAFSDTLPTDVTIATPAALTSTCGGDVSAPNGGGAISLADGLVGASQSCRIRVQVTSSTPGTHTNTTETLTSSAGNSGTASASLTVATDRPGFSKNFSPDTVFFGGRSTLTFIIDNTTNANFLTFLSFVDNLPTGMVIASPANRATTCGTTTIPPTLTATAGTTVVSLTADGTGAFPALGAGASCTVTVDVVGNSTGALENTTSELTSSGVGGSVSSGSASATLTVSASKLLLTKSFVDDPVSPGGTIELELVIRNLDRVSEATAIAFTDNLGAALTDLEAISSSSGCGGTVGGAGTLTFSGGTLAPEATCTVSATLQVPADATPGSYTNTTSSITADFGGDTVTGDPASDVLFVEAAPILTKEFLDPDTMAADPVVSAGNSVLLRFTIQNTSTIGNATDIAFLDELTDSNTSSASTGGFLPFPVSVLLPPVPDPPCGSGSSLALVGFGTDRQGLSLTDGNLAAGASCSFEVTLTLPNDLAPGRYLNTTEEITATVGGTTVTGRPASDDLDVIAAPELIKTFLEDPVAPGGTVTLEFTLEHDENSLGDATEIAFTDNLDGALAGLVATGLPASNICGAGSQIIGTDSLTFTGGSLAPDESCTFAVSLDVPSTAPAGPQLNVTSNVTATVLGQATTNDPASDNLVIEGLVLTKEFTNDPVLPGGTVTLSFTIDNNSPNSDATEIAFEDDLNDVVENLALSSSSVPQNDVCGTGSQLMGNSGNETLVLMGGNLLVGENCTFNVTIDVPAAADPGLYTNSTSNFSAMIGGQMTFFDNALDDLEIAEFLTFSKEFTDDPVLPGGTVNLRFTIANPTSSSATGLSFTDDLSLVLSGLVAGPGVSTCGGTVSGTGTDVIELTGGSLAAGASCTIDVPVSVPLSAPLASVLANTTSLLSSSLGTVAPASDDLRIESLVFTKSFDPATAEPGDTVTLTFDIENLSSTEAISDLEFSDNLNAVILGLEATGLPLLDPCGVGSELSGTSLLLLTGGNLLPGGSCTFSASVAVPPGTPAGVYDNVTSDLRRAGGSPAAAPTTASLEILDVQDADGDGVPDSLDFCPDTTIPEGVPTIELKPNRYALVDGDGIFDTVSNQDDDSDSGDSDSGDSDSGDSDSGDSDSGDSDSGDSDSDSEGSSQRVFTIEDTAGCSCEQIIEELDLGNGHTKFGCSLGAMREWVDFLSQSSPLRIEATRTGIRRTIP